MEVLTKKNIAKMGYKRDDVDYIWNVLQWYHPISQHFNGSNDTINKDAVISIARYKRSNSYGKKTFWKKFISNFNKKDKKNES